MGNKKKQEAHLTQKKKGWMIQAFSLEIYQYMVSLMGRPAGGTIYIGRFIGPGTAVRVRANEDAKRKELTSGAKSRAHFR
jgi:hypothetical protein